MTLLNGYKTPPAKESGELGLSPPTWPQSHTGSSSFSSPNLFCQKSSSKNNNVSDSHNLEDEGKSLYEDFVQEHLIVSPNKNGEVLTSGGSDIIRQEEQGSNCNIVFESNSTASKSTRTTGGLALQLGATELAKSKAGDVDEIKSLKKTFKNQAEEFIVAHSDSGKA